MDRKSALAIVEASGRVIQSAFLDKEAFKPRLVIAFTDGTTLWIEDFGQQCCEDRFMTTDDDLAYFSGATFWGLALRGNVTVEENSIMYHERQFLVISTSLGEFTVETHNIHNGYYDGFSIIARWAH